MQRSSDPDLPLASARRSGSAFKNTSDFDLTFLAHPRFGFFFREGDEMRAALRHARGPDWRDAGLQAESRVTGRRCRQARAHTTRGCRPGRPGRLRSPPSRRARFRARRRRARETRQLRETVRVRVGGVRGESRGPRGGPRGALGRCAPVRPRQVRPPDTSPDSVPRHLRTLRATARPREARKTPFAPARIFISPRRVRRRARR